MTQVVIELPDATTEYMKSQVTLGQSESISEFVRRLVEVHRERRAIEQKVLEADLDNNATPVTPEFFASMRQLAATGTAASTAGK